mmetsp:Transcript_3450/g.9961  ORF Transcript_3450/g.9961 Transcript_3450/m.9961 type:complete len:203 (-) Transcript_3450:350-958(-)
MRLRQDQQPLFRLEDPAATICKVKKPRSSHHAPIVNGDHLPRVEKVTDASVVPVRRGGADLHVVLAHDDIVLDPTLGSDVEHAAWHVGAVVERRIAERTSRREEGHPSSQRLRTSHLWDRRRCAAACRIQRSGAARSRGGRSAARLARLAHREASRERPAAEGRRRGRLGAEHRRAIRAAPPRRLACCRQLRRFGRRPARRP